MFLKEDHCEGSVDELLPLSLSLLPFAFLIEKTLTRENDVCLFASWFLEFLRFLERVTNIDVIGHFSFFLLHQTFLQCRYYLREFRKIKKIILENGCCAGE